MQSAKGTISNDEDRVDTLGIAEKIHCGSHNHFRQDGTSYWAFAPNALPPPFTLDAPLFLALSEADRALGELAGLGRNLAAEVPGFPQHRWFVQV